MSDTQETQAGVDTSNIHANVDPNTTVKEKKFGFRTIEDKETGTKTKRATVELKVAVLNVNGIIDVLQRGGKELDLLLSAVEEQYDSFIKDMLGSNEALTSENFPLDQVSWAAIANQPESERKGRGIAKEIWEDFVKSYISIMPSLTGMAAKHIEKQAAMFAQKLNPLVNHEQKEKILPQLKNQLTIYLNGAGADAESYAACVMFLMDKCDKILNADKESNLADNLGFAA